MKQKTIVVTIGMAALAAALLMASMTGCEQEVVEVAARVALVDPYITQHPQSALYLANATSIEDLSVEVEGWNPGDGAISVQWYQFATVIDYLNGDAEPVGTGFTYTPAITDKSAGKNYYYYAVVSNTNGIATDRQAASITSDIAVISFYSGSKPPLITRQPPNAQARFGRSINPLSVKATGTNPLAYLWYQVKFDDNGDFIDANGDGIPDGEKVILSQDEKDPATWIDSEVPEYENIVYETGFEYQPAPRQVRLGKNYFYVTVTDANGTTTSAPSIVDILLGLRAEAPVINTQPEPRLYFTGETTIAPLTVKAESLDLGTLSYQWYSNTTGSSKTGDPIPGATNDFYAPNLTANRNAFYFVVVTNYTENVIGAKTATANSRAVNVRTAAAASSTPSSTITLDSASRYNYVRGYGGMEVAWANFPETFPRDTELQYDPDRLGYNILRIMMPVTDTNIDKAMEYLVVTTRRRPNYYENVKIVNKYNGYVEASPWSPPKEWKSNNSINGGGFLRPQYYKQYAAYLKAFAQHMYNRGAPIYCISIQNEPNYTAGYDGCEWEPDEMRDFFIEVGNFTEGVRGFGGGKQTPRVLIVNGESANTVAINHPAIDDSRSYAVIDLFARHVYGERRTSLWETRPFVQQQDGKEVWMTEHNINSANALGYYNDSKWDYIWRFMNDVDLVMRLNNENAFVWWASKRFYSMVGDSQYGTPEGAALPRGWGLAHYSKYTIDTTRIGFSMTGTTLGGVAIGIAGGDQYGGAVNGATGDMDNTSARITAYISRDGSEITMVMWTPTLQDGAAVHNMGTIQIDMPDGFLIANAMAVRSRKLTDTQNEYMTPIEVDVSSDRRSAFVTLNASQIMSVRFTKQQ